MPTANRKKIFLEKIWLAAYDPNENTWFTFRRAHSLELCTNTLFRIYKQYDDGRFNLNVNNIITPNSESKAIGVY